MKSTAPNVYDWMVNVTAVMWGVRAGIEPLLLVFGRAWAFGDVDVERSKSVPLRFAQPRQCFINAFRYATQHKKVGYCEGLAIPGKGFPLAVHHAWCIDGKTNKVVDPTWAHVGDGITNGAQYVGIVLPTDLVRSIARFHPTTDLLWSEKALRYLGATFRRGSPTRAWVKQLSIAAKQRLAKCANTAAESGQ